MSLLPLMIRIIMITIPTLLFYTLPLLKHKQFNAQNNRFYDKKQDNRRDLKTKQDKKSKRQKGLMNDTFLI